MLSKRIKIRLWTGVSTLALALLSGPARAQGASDKSDQFLQEKMRSGRAGWSSVILQADGPITREREAELGRSAIIVDRLPGYNALVLRINHGQLKKVAELPWVARLSEDVETRKSDDFAIKGILADAAFARYDVSGNKIGVAVLDSGVLPHADLTTSSGTSRITASVSFVPGDPSTLDANGHGTHIAGLIAGDGSASSGPGTIRTFRGIARKASIINVRVLDAEGAGLVSTVIKGIDWCIENRAKFNIRVMNLSLGHPVGESYATDPLCLAVERAWKAGIVVVVAAGNGGRLNSAPAAGEANDGYGTAYGSITSPGNSPYAITVGAMKQNVEGVRDMDRVASYSSRGPSRIDYVMKPDLVAPGNHIVSLRAPGATLDVRYSGNQVPVSDYRLTGNESDYYVLSGTSMAAAVVSGAAALMLNQNPKLSPDTVKARLMITADRWRSDGRLQGDYDVFACGAGYVNVLRALESDITPSRYAVTPTLTLDENGEVRVDTSNVTWGNNITWGTNVIWGEIWGIPGVTGFNVIWGEGLGWSGVVSGAKVIWGSVILQDNVTWGTGFLFDAVMCSLRGDD